MKIAIDCRPLVNQPSGIPNYIISAINAISLMYPEWELFLLSNNEFHSENSQKLIRRPNVKIRIVPLQWIKNLGIIWYVFKISSLLKQIQPNIFWAPNFLLPPVLPAGIKTLITVHDCVPKRYRSTMSRTNRLFFDVLNEQSVMKADKIWAVSEYTKIEIEELYPKRKCKHIFVGSSINHDVFRQIQVLEAERDEILKKYNLPPKFILFVGTLEPRKNLSFLLSLMPALSKQGFALLVIGGKGWGNTGINTIIQAEGYPKNNVSFAGFVPTEELVKVYNIASMYVSTSQNEGFGLPQMEAMACGCPVVSPHNSAMIEVVEGAGETVKGWSPQDWVDTINKVYLNRSAYIEAGLGRSRESSWDTIVSRLSSYIKL